MEDLLTASAEIMVKGTVGTTYRAELPSEACCFLAIRGLLFLPDPFPHGDVCDKYEIDPAPYIVLLHPSLREMDRPESMVRKLIQEDDSSKWIAHSNHNVKCFTENEINRITNSYRTILGRGAFGQVYEGVLDDKSRVAVKMFTHNVKENFAKELTVHREINHKNVVRLIGYCLEENALMMVTEYIPKGNLNNVLRRDDISIPLDTRLRIAVECAEALGYMHSQMYTQVIHGDIKPANILLDDHLNAKISDFGISRLVNTDNTVYTNHVFGTLGYMDPSFVQTGRLTAKSDVYSFGVVLLELITRKKARTDDGKISLVDSFTKALAKGTRMVREMFDAEIATPSDMKTIEEIAKLAGKCLRMEINKRPQMLEVAEQLRTLRKAQHQPKGCLGGFFSRGRKNNSVPVETGQAVQNNPALSGKSSRRGEENTRLVFFGSASAALRLDMEDLLTASAEIMGKGTVGTTYRAELPSGAELVVKRLKDAFLPKAEFEQRIMAIGAIQNEHIVPLRGYYYSKDEKLLIYDRFPMGSLSNVLHGDWASAAAPLDWEQRSAIALAAARGVASIHSAGPSSSHGNIRSSNVLLTGTHEARVSEHGLTTLLSPDFTPGRLLGYRAPEVADIRMVSQKDDVYSFGVLLLELLTRKPPIHAVLKEEGVDLPRWVSSVVREEWTAEVFDMELLRQQHEGGEEEGMVQLLQLALDCCSKYADSRPAMSEVAQRIDEILQS